MIELDIATPWEPPDPASAEAAMPAWVTLAAALMVFLGTIAAGAPAHSVAPFVSVETGAREIRFGTDVGYLLNHLNGQRAELSGYRLSDGVRIWQTSLTGWVSQWLVDGERVALTRQRSGEISSGQATTEVYDGATGLTKWSRTGVTLVAVNRDAVVVRERVDGRVLGTRAPARQLLALAWDSGDVRWEWFTHDGTIWASEAGPTGPAGQRRMVELDADGGVRAIDLLTGQPSPTVQIDPPGTANLVVAGDGVLVVRDGSPGDGLRGYDLATGRLLWSLNHRSFLAPCGKYLCGETGAVPTVLDTTGQVRWRAANEARFMVVGDRLLAPAGGVYGLPGSQLVELSTGRVIRAYGDWQMISEPVNGRALAVINERQALTVGIVDIESGNAIVVGRATDWIGQATCASGARHIGCTNGLRLVLWRVPTAQVAGAH
jgi:hypothetical protein